MTFKDQLQQLKEEVNIHNGRPPVSLHTYFSKNYDDMNDLIRLVRHINKDNKDNTKEEIDQIAFKKISDMALNDGITISRGKPITIKQVVYFLGVIHRERKALKQATKNEGDAPLIDTKEQQTTQPNEIVKPKPVVVEEVVPLSEKPPISKEEAKLLTKATIGWDRKKFEEVASMYYHEHPSYWKFGLELQYIIAWLKDDAPSLDDPTHPDRTKGNSGWTYGDFWSEYNKARSLRDLKIKKVG